MRIDLPSNSLYGNQPIPIEIPDDWDVDISTFKGAQAPSMSVNAIRELFRGPNSKINIASDAKGCKDAIIIFDDITRPTPIEPIAKVIIEELEEAGVPRNKIRFMAATGSHRAMSGEEYVRKLGNDIVDEFRIYSHNPFFNNINVGMFDYGIPIELNADCVKADYKVGIGTIFPHPQTGFGGGGKLILPGIASLETIRRFHQLSAGRLKLDTESRQITIKAAELLGLNCKVDALLNGNGEIAQLFVGDVKNNIEQNYAQILDFYETKRLKPVDVLIANNYFKPTEASLAVCDPKFYSMLKEQGTLIVAANSPNGAAAHYLQGRWGDCGIGGVAYAGEGRIPEKVKEYYAFSERIDKATAIQYHYNSPDDPRFHWAKTWQEILDKLGKAPKSVGVLLYASVLCLND